MRSTLKHSVRYNGDLMSAGRLLLPPNLCTVITHSGVGHTFKAEKSCLGHALECEVPHLIVTMHGTVVPSTKSSRPFQSPNLSSIIILSGVGLIPKAGHVCLARAPIETCSASSSHGVRHYCTKGKARTNHIDCFECQRQIENLGRTSRI